MRGYFDVFIEHVMVTGIVFEDTLKVILAFLLKCRPRKFHWKADQEQTVHFTRDLFCITVKFQLLIFTTRWYFSIN